MTPSDKNGRVVIDTEGFIEKLESFLKDDKIYTTIKERKVNLDGQKLNKSVKKLLKNENKTRRKLIIITKYTHTI